MIWEVYEYDFQTERYERPYAMFMEETAARGCKREKGWVGVRRLTVWRGLEEWKAAVAYLGRDDQYGSVIRVYDTAEEKRAEVKEEFRRKALLKLTMEEREALGLPRLPEARKH